MNVLQELKTKILLFDGGTGSLLQEAGLKPGELPETWNITRPDFIVKLHRDYLEAGCDIIKTNTFGANRFKYNSSFEYGLKEIVTAAMENAKRAVREAGKGYIALDLGPTGKLLKPIGQLEFEEAVTVYREVVEIGAAQGADLILIETMSDTYELKAAVLAARENSALPVFATVIFDEKGKMLTGGTPKAVIGLLEGLRVDAIGMNCGLGPIQMKPLAAEFLKYASVPVIVNPNAGLPRSEDGKTVYDIGPDEFETAMKEILDLGINVAGGCCGTTPEHIKRLDRLRKGREQKLPGDKQLTVATSYASAVEFGADPVIIGERINPTGKAKYKQALNEKNMEFILEEGISQQESGAHVLDINVGLPEIDEPEIMALAVQELQGITELPLQIDTTNTEAMARAMRIYNGKIMVNSVNGKQEIMDAVFPLVKRYGGVVVALTLDEQGIPGTSEGRIEVAQKIYREAEKYGIGKKDILIDALCMTVSSDPLGALTTLETVRRIRDELGGKTILGVSNISFGLPVRENINANFFTMALYSGLNAAIINPGSEPMMCAYRSFRALAALDENCAGYIDAYKDAGQTSAAGAGLISGDMYSKSPETPETAGTPETSETPGGVPSGEGGEARLFLSVLKGLKEQAGRAAEELLFDKEPLDVINTCMIPALDRVGKGYEAGTVFLPQLLMSAEAAKAAFDVIREKLDESGRSGGKKGKIILATVKGDIHDIGKNIVRVLLENYGYEVIDLGKDVPPERIVREAEEKHVPLVGLSALMTTTVPAMQRTIAGLKEKAPWVKVMVGGAVLTPEYAEMIGADAYCSDALASVSYARKIIG
ncbi:homocysteine S-methyltransferase family protein [Clostridium transplantifaecale]|uniref:homocysteine S-methyltransferase family protein n=1 Tax=Clostridium transplantifaecale TaxID=2479838 RepID=UPI000F635CA5|nr:homocysteine S-methyltransferase family protein [Clostridium transplantifaecale]